MSEDHRLRVLIVEDEVILATELEYLVEVSGAEPVGHAMTSPEAVALAERLHPDLALVDVHLGDGPTGVDAVRADHADRDAPGIHLRGHPHRAVGTVAGVDAQHPPPLAERDDPTVGVRVPGRHVHEPDAGQIGVPKGATLPGQRVLRDQRRGGRMQFRCDDAHDGPLVEEPLHPAGGDRPSPDEQHVAAGQRDSEHERHRSSSRSMCTASSCSTTCQTRRFCAARPCVSMSSAPHPRSICGGSA